MVLVLEAERCDGKVNTTIFINLDTIPLNENVEHCHEIAGKRIIGILVFHQFNGLRIPGIYELATSCCLSLLFNERGNIVQETLLDK